MNPRIGRVVIDGRRFLRVGGIPVCRITEDGRLEFKDKDGRRSQNRGSAFVVITADQIAQAIESAPSTNGRAKSEDLND